MQCNHSCVFQSRFRSSLFLAGYVIGTGSLSHAGLLQKGPIGYMGLTYRHGFPWLDREMHPRFTFYSWLHTELPEKPANLPHLKTHWTGSVFHWYDYLAAIFIPSLGTTDFMLRVDALSLLIRLYKIFKIRPLMVNKCKLEGWFYKTD